MCFRKYYTDVHEVDEDATTILNQGGMWHDIGMAGVTFRYMAYDPSDIFGTVASKNNVQPPSLLGGCTLFFEATTLSVLDETYPINRHAIPVVMS